MKNLHKHYKMIHIYNKIYLTLNIVKKNNYFNKIQKCRQLNQFKR